mgnify:CR=1 FL=1
MKDVEYKYMRERFLPILQTGYERQRMGPG